MTLRFGLPLFFYRRGKKVRKRERAPSSPFHREFLGGLRGAVAEGTLNGVHLLGRSSPPF